MNYVDPIEFLNYGTTFTVGSVPVYVSWGFAVFMAIVFRITRKFLKGDNISGRDLNLYALLGAGLVAFSLTAHEFAHAAVNMSYGNSITMVRFGLTGGGMLSSVNTEMSMLQTLLVICVGPLTHLALWAQCEIVLRDMKKSPLEATIDFVSAANRWFLILNLLPIMMLDGGWAVKTILSPLLPEAQVETVVMVTSALGIIYIFARWLNGTRPAEQPVPNN